MSKHRGFIRLESRDDERVVQLPAEEIGTLIFDTPAATVTTQALVSICTHGGTVLLVDEGHSPTCVLIPYYQNARSLATAKIQLSTPLPVKKQIWKRIVVAKIMNQMRCMESFGLDGSELGRIASRVRSGDTTNCEAQAARAYFDSLISEGDRWCSEYTVALNYGYAVLRSIVAQAVASRGWIPSIGIHHRSEQNPFNLVDDLIEPFRPVVDSIVFGYCITILGPDEKRLLTGCHELTMEVDDIRTNVRAAISMFVDSFRDAMEEGKPELLKNPIFTLEACRSQI